MAQNRGFAVFCDENARPSNDGLRLKNRVPLGEIKLSQTSNISNLLRDSRQHLKQPFASLPQKSLPVQCENAVTFPENDRFTTARQNGQALNSRENIAVCDTNFSTFGKENRPSAVQQQNVEKIGDISMSSPYPGSPMTIDANTPARSFTNEQRFDDGFFTKIYGESHYEYFREMETRLKPRADYMSKQKDITISMRSVLVDWMVEVNEEYKMNDDTLFLAVSLIDRFLSQMHVVRGKLQLVGTAAIFIASKYEEIYPPDISELVYITDDTYTKSQIIRMESLILRTLQFSIGGSTSLQFARRLAIVSNCSMRVAHMAQYICELALLDTKFLQYRPSVIGLSAMILAHALVENYFQWTPELEEFTGIKPSQVRCCIDELHVIVRDSATSKHRSIFEKYAVEKYSCVANLTIAEHLPTLANI